MSLETTTSWYESYVVGNKETAWFTVFERGSGEPIGWTELKAIDYRNRSAEFAIMIGEPPARGKGYGTETARLILDYGFTALGLHNIHLYYFAFNPAAGRAYEKAGFREYARRRESHLMGGKFWDTVYMECLTTEFESLLLSTIFTPDMPRVYPT
jgi:RimJ/RimL family protein N-acetyltransferase